MGTPFESLDEKDQDYWRKGYKDYVGRMEDEGLSPRPFKIWITDFGFTHK